MQDTLLAAWQGLAGFEGRASIRTWLYRIATNRCLDTLRATSRRPAKQWDIPGVDPPEPTRLGEVVWLEPYPDTLLEDALAVPLGPEARYEQTESISLAFVTALQVLPPRQLAVLVLRDVLGFHAKEVAEMLDTTVESVTSALKRGRASLRESADRGTQRRQLTHLPSRRSWPRSSERTVRGSRRDRRPADRRRLHVDATDAPRIPGPRRRRPVLCGHPSPRPEIRPRPYASQRSTCLRHVPPRSRRRPRRNRDVRAHPHRRPDLRHDSLRKQRVPMVRATAIVSPPIVLFACRPTPRRVSPSERQRARLVNLPGPVSLRRHRLTHPTGGCQPVFNSN